MTVNSTDRLALSIAEACGIPTENLVAITASFRVAEIPSVTTEHHVWNPPVIDVVKQRWTPLDAPNDLLSALVDESPCEFDHHGGCQAHGYISLQPGEECPQAELKRLLASRDITPNPREAR